MVVVRISPGLANAMYEFATAYALARERKQELVLDIAECTVSAWGYSLDYFQIPRVKKIIYPTQDVMHMGHIDVKGIFPELKKGKIVCVEGEDGENINYTSLEMAQHIKKEADLYLCGYFFDRDRYYLKYWDEIRGLFTLRKEYAEVKHFQTIIQGRTSVGVHIRRGDMLLADWAVKMEDDYYRAAIACCREHFDNCIFMVFSDDIAYARKILGKDSSLYYVHFLGYDDAALKEFTCLSMCTHRIMSNSSTFSRLADELNWAEGRKTFWKELSQEGQEDHSTIDFNRRNIRLNTYDIKNYAVKYCTDCKENIVEYNTLVTQILQTDVNEHNCVMLLDKICECSMNVYDLPYNFASRLLYQNFLCYLKLNQAHEALQSAWKLYDEYADDSKFMEGLAEALLHVGAYEEAVIEQIRMNRKKISFGECAGEQLLYCKTIAQKLITTRKHFIIIPFTPMFASSRIVGLVELGMVLYHLGHDVTFVFSALDPSEKTYIHSHKLLTNRQEVCLGCEQYLEEDIEKDKEGFLRQYANEDVVLISRKSKYFIDKERLGNMQIQYIFADFTDDRDAESVSASQGIEKDELDRLYAKADRVLTKNLKLKNNSNKYVYWEDNDNANTYQVIDTDWEFGREGRLTRRAIGMAADMIVNLCQR